jgi:hypothetical protein
MIKVVFPKCKNDTEHELIEILGERKYKIRYRRCSKEFTVTGKRDDATNLSNSNLDRK